MTVEVLGVNVPETTKGVPLPERVIVRDEASIVPTEIFKTVATDRLSDNVHAPPEPLKVKLLKALAPDVIVFPDDVAFIVTVPELWVNVPALLHEPATVIEDGAVTEPFVIVKLLSIT